MSNNFYIKYNHEKCWERLDENTHPEAGVLRKAIHKLSYHYPYLLDYEYEIPGVSKGDALLCNEGYDDLKVLVLEAKHINYSSSVNRGNQMDKKRELRHQVAKYERYAKDYIRTKHRHLYDNYDLTIEAKGCYNNVYGEIEFLGEEQEQGVVFQTHEARVSNKEEEEGFGWGKALAVGAMVVGGLAVASSVSSSRQNINQRGTTNTNQTNRNAQDEDENQENCHIM